MSTTGTALPLSDWYMFCLSNIMLHFTNLILAMIEGDPVDVALSWATTNEKEGEIPIISMANDKRPGGDWEASKSIALPLRICY
jgi:hypothetical protein